MKQKDSSDHRNSRGGFTLVEVLLVVAILGILAGVVVVNLSGRRESANIQATRASIASVCTALDLYEVDTGRYPSSLEGLVSSDGAANWNGPYLQGGAPADAWGTKLSLQRSEGGYKVISAGPDMSMGGGDDITSH